MKDANWREVLRDPRHPYTRALLGSVPRLDPAAGSELAWIPGSPPDLSLPVEGCAFRPRCPVAVARCAHDDPRLADDPRGSAACWVAAGASDAPAAAGAAR